MDDVRTPQLTNDEAATESKALKTAIAESRTDPRGVPHSEMRLWLMEIAEGNFTAPPPVPRLP
jgi:hypothetical protein